MMGQAEDWHYVGGTDEPAFQNSWANVSTLPKLAFRIREAGVVDLQGVISGGASGATIFTLPEGYRPAAQCNIPIATYQAVPGYSGAMLTITAAGVVSASFNTAGSQVYIFTQVFVASPDVA